MKHFFFLLLSIISFVLTAQEQITNILSEGSTTRYILKEYNGEKYIMTTVPFDSLKVYKLVNGTAIFQYGRKFDGIYSMYTYSTTNQFLLFSDATSSKAYNFTNNTLLEIPYEGALENTSWYYSQALGDEIVLRQNTNDFTVSKQYLYNLASGQNRLLNSDHYFLKIGNERLYAYKDLNEVSSQLYIIDKENLTIIDSTTVPLIGRGHDFFDEEDYFVYVTTNEVKRYKFSTKEHELVKTIDQSYQSIRLNKSNEEYVIDVVQFQNHNLIRVHRETLQSSQVFLGDEYANPYPDILYGKYIIPGNQLFVLDTATGQKVSFLSSTRGSGYAILENRYIVYYFVDKHLMLDLATMEQHVLSQMPIKTTANNSEVMYDNGIYLVNFDNYFGNNQKLYEIDLVTKKGTFSNKIINSNEGLPNSSTIIKVKDDVLLVNVENLYHVNGNKATKLNSKIPLLIRNSNYKIDDDVFYWCEFTSSKYNIYKVENGQAVNIASIPNLIGNAPSNIIILEDFFVTPDAIFFKGGNPENKQYRYDLQSNETTEVSNVKNREYHGIYHNGNYYYTDISKVVMLKTDGNKIDINLNFAHGFENPFIRYKSRLFIKNQEGLLEVVDDKIELRIPNPNESVFRINLIDGLIILTDHPDDYIYDGIATYKITSSTDQFRGFKILNDYFVIYDGIASNTTIASFLNFKTNTSFTLPNDIAKLKNIRLFRNAGKYILLGSDGLSPYHKIEIYETDENFSYFSNINEFNVTSNGVISSFTEYVNEGFLHTGNAMYLMDTLLNFVPIDGLAAENQTSAVFVQDGYFYFIAIHPINGRQLFRIQPFSLRTSVDDDAALFTKVNVYPNPSSQEINIEGEAFNTAEIYNFSGHMVQKSSIGDSKRIAIGDLNNGVYIVILTSSDGSKSVGKFIKVD